MSDFTAKRIKTGFVQQFQSMLNHYLRTGKRLPLKDAAAAASKRK